MTIGILSPPFTAIQLQFFIARCAAIVNFICCLQCPLTRYTHLKFWVALTHYCPRSLCRAMCAILVDHHDYSQRIFHAMDLY